MGLSRSQSTLRVGALLVLSGCFILSALIRAGEVVAALPEKMDDGFGNPIATPKDAATTVDANAEPAKGPQELLEELSRQREELSARNAALDAREQKLKSLQTRLQNRLKELRDTHERIYKTAALVDNAAGKDVERLAQMYQQMKPKQAGQIFNEMAPSFAAGFLAEMRPDVAALIMANMSADKAYAVTLMLAGRNVDKPSLGDAATEEAPVSPAAD